MKKAGMIFSNTLRGSRNMLMVSLVCGAAFCVLFNMITDISNVERIPIGLLAHEETAVTRDFRVYLSDEMNMNVLESGDIEYLNTELVERHIAGIVEVPKGFEAMLLDSTPIPLEISFLDDYANAAFMRAYLESYTASVMTLALGAGGDGEMLMKMMEEMPTELIPVEMQRNNGVSQISASHESAFLLVMGFYLMFSFLLVFSTAFQLFNDRQSGVYGRIRVTNTRTAQYLAGTCAVGMCNAVALILPFCIFVLVTKPMIDVSPWPIVALCLLYDFMVVGIALVVSLYLKTRSAISICIIFVSTITCMLGGAYFPIETAPDFLQKLSRGMPQFWFINAVERLLEDASATWWQSALIIGLFAILFYIIAGVRYVSRDQLKPS